MILVKKITVLNYFLSQAALNNYNLKRGQECCLYLNLSTYISVCPVFWGAIRSELHGCASLMNLFIYLFLNTCFSSKFLQWSGNLNLLCYLWSVMFKGLRIFSVADWFWGESHVVSVTALWNCCHLFHFPNFYLKVHTICCLVFLLCCVVWRWISDVKGVTKIHCYMILSLCKLNLKLEQHVEFQYSFRK